MAQRKSVPSKHPKARSKRPSPPRQRIPLMIAGETAPDEHNANVQQSEASAENGQGDPWGDQKLYGKKKPQGEFTPGEIGELHQNDIPEPDNPQAVQGGRGPLSQEGEGNRQNAEAAELEDQKPNLEP